MRHFFFFLLFTLITITPFAFASSTEISDILQLVADIPLGLPEAKLKSYAPDAKQNREDIKDKSMALYVLTFDEPPLSSLNFAFNNRKLTNITGMSKNGFFSSGWEDADGIVKEGQNFVTSVIRQWGKPALARSKTSPTGLVQVAFQWRVNNWAINLVFTPPSYLMANSGLDRDLNGGLLLWKSPLDRDGAHIEKNYPDPFDEAMLEGNYAEYRKRMEVNPAPETSRLMPELLKNIYIGMTTDELKSRRKKVTADDFFNDSWMFYEKLEDPFLFVISYRARMGHLVSVTASPEHKLSETPEKFAEFLALVLEKWGNPQQVLIPKRKGETSNPYVSIFYIWDHKDAKTVLRLTQPKPFASISIIEKNLPLKCLLYGRGEYDLKPLNAEDINRLRNYSFAKP